MSSSYLAMACLFAKKTKAVLIMREMPIWLNLTECNGFVDMVEMIMNNCFVNKEFNKFKDYKKIVENSFQFLADSYQDMFNNEEFNQGSPLEMEDKIKFVIISNAQGNIADYVEESACIISNIKNAKIVYWNLSEWSIEDIQRYKETLIVSGLSKSLVKHLMHFSYDNYYFMLCHILNHPRYDTLATSFDRTYNIKISNISEVI